MLNLRDRRYSALLQKEEDTPSYNHIDDACVRGAARARARSRPSSGGSQYRGCAARGWSRLERRGAGLWRLAGGCDIVVGGWERRV
mgnify:CR=1 FL=1